MDFENYINWCKYLGKGEKNFLLSQDFSIDEKNAIIEEISTYISWYEENSKILQAVYWAWCWSLAWLFLEIKKDAIQYEEEVIINSKLDNFY